MFRNIQRLNNRQKEEVERLGEINEERTPHDVDYLYDNDLNAEAENQEVLDTQNYIILDKVYKISLLVGMVVSFVTLTMNIIRLVKRLKKDE